MNNARNEDADASGPQENGGNPRVQRPGERKAPTARKRRTQRSGGPQARTARRAEPPTTHLRISARDAARIKRIAVRTGLSIPELLARATSLLITDSESGALADVEVSNRELARMTRKLAAKQAAYDAARSQAQ